MYIPHLHSCEGSHYVNFAICLYRRGFKQTSTCSSNGLYVRTIHDCTCVDTTAYTNTKSSINTTVCISGPLTSNYTSHPHSCVGQYNVNFVICLGLKDQHRPSMCNPKLWLQINWTVCSNCTCANTSSVCVCFGIVHQ